MADPAVRDALLVRVTDALRADDRLAAAVLVGSGAFGFRDEESDLDVVAAVGAEYDAGDLYREWASRLAEMLPLVYRARPCAFQLTHRLHNTLLDAGGALLELDLSFTPLANLRATSEHWRVLFDRTPTGEAHHRMAAPLPPSAMAEALPLMDAACYRVLECRKALRRGRVWQAALVLHELLELVLRIAVVARCDEADDAWRRANHQRLVDDLPGALLEEVARTLAPVEHVALAAALGRATGVLLDEARRLYRWTGEPFPDRFAEALASHTARVYQMAGRDPPRAQTDPPPASAG